MRRHGLNGWSFGFDRARRRAGQTNYTDRIITISAPLTELATRHQVTDTILHEIAHALVGEGHGHDAVWRNAARRIGATPRRVVDRDYPQIPGRWQAVCPAGHVHTRHRKPRGRYSCGRCARGFSEEHSLTWVDVGYSNNQANMHQMRTTSISRG